MDFCDDFVCFLVDNNDQLIASVKEKAIFQTKKSSENKHELNIY